MTSPQILIAIIIWGILGTWWICLVADKDDSPSMFKVCLAILLAGPIVWVYTLTRAAAFIFNSIIK